VRARELGIDICRLAPGAANAITDVAGVSVGHTTLVEGDAVRTGVTVLHPHEGDPRVDPLFAGCHRLNGNGEVTGLEWVRESGMLTTPIGLTNTHSVGVVRDAIVSFRDPGLGRWSLPVVGETYDGFLNDIGGQHVRAEDVHEALRSAAGGVVAEGCVGGGTGMICHGFKGGIGTSSRVVAEEDGGFVVGVLVQANYGARRRLRVAGVPVGERIGPEVVPPPAEGGGPGAGSIIVVVATDAPLLPGQCDRVAQRACLAIGRTGGMGEHSSGDFAVCFATGNRGLSAEKGERRQLVYDVRMLSPDCNALFEAVIDATEEAILNALLAAETMTGRGGNTVHALPHDLLLDAIRASSVGSG
jgi:D-aminopeptidase